MQLEETLRIFIASSSEQLGVAHKVKDKINNSPLLSTAPVTVEAEVWNEEVFNFSQSCMESLEHQLDRADFAIVILTANDTGVVRKQSVNLPRDNVIFELGLFMGRLARERCCFFIDGSSKTHVLSDLSGINSVNYFPGNGSRVSARPGLKAQVEYVLERILKLGIRYKLSGKARDTRERHWKFNRRVQGQYWERMRRGEDNASAISYVTITADEVTNSPNLVGLAYDLEGNFLAEWESILTGVLLDSKPTIYYRWKGEHEHSRGQIYGGGGRIVFDDDKLMAGNGYFYDTNYAEVGPVGTIRRKNFGLFRSTAPERAIMKNPRSDEAKALRVLKLNELKGF